MFLHLQSLITFHFFLVPALPITALLPHKNIAKLFPHSGSLLFTKQEEGAHWPLGSCCVLQHLFLGQLVEHDRLFVVGFGRVV